MSVSKSIDSYIEEKYERQALWIAELSNGEHIYQDDERPGESEHSAWLRLKEYIYENKLHILSITIKFRSNVLCVCNTPVDGWFFRHAALGSFGSTKTLAFYLVGFIKNGTLKVIKYRVPEILFENSEERDIQESFESIIFNKNYGTET